METQDNEETGSRGVRKGDNMGFAGMFTGVLLLTIAALIVMFMYVIAGFLWAVLWVFSQPLRINKIRYAWWKENILANAREIVNILNPFRKQV
jgi:hypothetical protein